MKDNKNANAPCPCFGRCGGCALQNIDYESQLALKKEKLTTLLARAGLEKFPPLSVVPSAPFEYRERFQFHRVDLQKQKTSLKYKPLSENKAIPQAGFSAYHRNEIVPVADCLIASPVIRAALREGAIKPPLNQNRWTVYGRGGLLLQEGGDQRGVVSICGKEITVDVALFFQSNGAMLEKLIERVIAIARNAPSASDAGDFYCGIGTFALFLQDMFPRLDLLEENASSIALAKQNLKPDGHLRFFAMTDNQWVRHWARKSAESQPRYGFLCLDPGRKGLSAAMRQWLCANKPAVTAYISCDAAALARDAAALTRGAFTLQSLTIYDFYPQTEHIETLAVFAA